MKIPDISIETFESNRGECISWDTIEEFRALLSLHKLSESDYSTINDILGRPPTKTELGVFSAMWSEHCSYKSSKVHLSRLPSSGNKVVVGPGENAGVVRLHEDLCIAFKMESHNHPSFIDPYQGATTGVGGIMRDVFCMGARPICNLNALRFGRVDAQKTAWLFDGVVRGIGDYGNCMGVPTVAGSIAFNSSYDGNNLVNAMTVGVVKEQNIFKGFASGEGNLLVYVGAATGRDGINGATMASDSFDGDSKQDRSAIQVGDPFYEKLLLEATLEALEANLVVGIQDMGAAGLTSSLFEMADRARTGLLIDLDRVPVRAQGMSAYELMLSESQERMAMVVEKQNLQELKKIFDKWQLSYDVIGKVTNTGRVQGIYKGSLELDVPVAPLAEHAPKLQRPIKKRILGAPFEFDGVTKHKDKSIEQLLCELLSYTSETSLIYEQYDHQIGAKTCLGPKDGGAAVVWLGRDAPKLKPYLGLVVTANCLEQYCVVDPYWGAVHSVLKCFRAIVAAGGQALAITDCLNYGNPENPEVMSDFSQGVDGISLACQQLSLPVVSGNVSLYNETDGKSIPPTPMIGMVGDMTDVREARSAVAKEVGELWLLSPLNDQCVAWGGSPLSQVHGFQQYAPLPAIDFEAELEIKKLLFQLPGVLSVRDVGRGGLLPGIAKMQIPKKFGFKMDALLDRKQLFAERSGSYLVLLDAAKRPMILDKNEHLKHASISFLGSLHQDDEDLVIGNTRVDGEVLRNHYYSSMAKLAGDSHG